MTARGEADPTQVPPRELKRGSRGACRVDTSLEVRMSSPVHRERGSVVRSARPIARRRARRRAARACKSGGTTFTRRREGASEARCGFWYKPRAAGMHSRARELGSVPQTVQRDGRRQVTLGGVGLGAAHGWHADGSRTAVTAVSGDRRGAVAVREAYTERRRPGFRAGTSSAIQIGRAHV